MKAALPWFLAATVLALLTQTSCRSPVSRSGSKDQSDLTLSFIVSGSSAPKTKLILGNAATLAVSLTKDGSRTPTETKTVGIGSADTTVSASFPNLEYGQYVVRAIAEDVSGNAVAKQESRLNIGEDSVEEAVLYLLPAVVDAESVAGSIAEQVIVGDGTIAPGESRTWAIPESSRHRGKMVFDLGSTDPSVLIFIQDMDGVLLSESSSARKGIANSTKPGSFYLTVYNSGSHAYAVTLDINDGEQLFYIGDGTAESPFQVSDAEGLDYARNYLGTTACFVQTADIDMASFGPFEPIGSSSENSFSGTYDGGGHAISHLAVSGDADYRGLFGYALNATLKNIRLTNPTISGGSDIGSLAGFAKQSAVTGCSATGGTVVGTGSPVAVGGLIGYAEGPGGAVVSGCSASVALSGPIQEAGGLIGHIGGDISVSGCVSAGSLATTATGSNCDVGGFAGYIYGGGTTVSECSSTASVTAVTGSGGTQSVGGFAGYIFAPTIQRSSSTGSVSGGPQTGGFAGTAATSSKILNCYSRGAAVTGYGTCAGFLGSGSSDTISFCYAANSLVDSSGGGGYGFAYEESSQTLADCYWDTEVSGTETSGDEGGGANGLPSESMKPSAAFSGWDAGIWTFTAGAYPTLAWQQ